MASPAANIALYRIFHLRARVPRPLPRGPVSIQPQPSRPRPGGLRGRPGALCRMPIKTRRLADEFDVTGTPRSALI
ncbi:hypothetical protein GCM10027161_19310 [Microbispora hainanensis]